MSAPPLAVTNTTVVLGLAGVGVAVIVCTNVLVKKTVLSVEPFGTEVALIAGPVAAGVAVPVGKGLVVGGISVFRLAVDNAAVPFAIGTIFGATRPSILRTRTLKSLVVISMMWDRSGLPGKVMLALIKCLHWTSENVSTRSP